MRDKPATPHGQVETNNNESFLQRFSRLKTEARQSERATDAVAEQTTVVPVNEIEPIEEVEPPGDDDMPPLETLTVDSDYSGFFSPKVSDTLRKAALRKLFHSAQFNVIDELDDYAEDFTTFQSLGDIVTADMKHQLEVQAKRAAETLKQQLLDEPGPADKEPVAQASDDLGEDPTDNEDASDITNDEESKQG